MAKYDDASWHYGGDYPKDLPNESAATHIGMFLAWCINHDLVSDIHKEEDDETEIQKVKERKMTGGEFLICVCDEKFLDEDLSELGQAFANDYYEDKSKSAKKANDYGNDFCDVFNEKAEKNGFEYPSLYHVEDTWENYDLMAKRIDKRFAEWKQFKNL